MKNNTCPGVMVSTCRGRGDYYTGDFGCDSEAVQKAYDEMMNSSELPRTLILDAAARPFEMNAPLDIWQSKCRVTSTGGTVLIPADGYSDPLVTSGLRTETEQGEDGLISDVVVDNLWIDGRNLAQGIKLKHIQLSTINSVHVKNTNGPGLWLSDFCIENLFSDIVLSDECGNDRYPALLIEPENESDLDCNDRGNITVNSTRFAGAMIHFPANDALRVSAGKAQVGMTRRHRKIQFSGCYFHGHGRQTRPLVTLEDAFEIGFVGTQMLVWRDDGIIMQIGAAGSQWPAGITMISHCIFAAKPGSTVTGIRTENVDIGCPCLSVFGNSFGSDDARIGHAVDWGEQEGKMASWAGNMVNTSGESHVGVLPEDADCLPWSVVSAL